MWVVLLVQPGGRYCAGKASGFRAQSLSKLLRYIWSGVHKEMSSILAAIAPSNKSPNSGVGEGCGVSANGFSCAHGAQINFGDLIPYLTYVLGGKICLYYDVK